MVKTQAEIESKVERAKQKQTLAFEAKQDAIKKLNTGKLNAKQQKEYADIKNKKINAISIGCGKACFIKVHPMTIDKDTGKTGIAIVYMAKVRNAKGREGVKQFGIYGKISLANARKKAQELRQASIKKYPKNEEIGSSKKFEDLHNEWIDVITSKLAKSSKSNLKARYNTVLSVLANYKLRELNTQMIIAKLKAVETPHNNRVNALRDLIRSLNYAVNSALLKTNPAITIKDLPEFKFDKSQVKGMKEAKFEELKEKFFSKLANINKPMSKIFFLLVALTTTRGEEIHRLRWSWINYNDTDISPYGAITIPKDEIKTKHTHLKDHVIYLTKQMRAVLDFWNGYLKTFSGDDLLFFSLKDRNFKKPVRMNTLKQPITDLVSQDLTLHSLRNAFMSHYQEILDKRDLPQYASYSWLSEKVFKACINHKLDTDVELAYNKYGYGHGKYKLWSDWNNALIEQIPSEYLDFGDRKLELLPG